MNRKITQHFGLLISKYDQLDLNNIMLAPLKSCFVNPNSYWNLDIGLPQTRNLRN